MLARLQRTAVLAALMVALAWWLWCRHLGLGLGWWVAGGLLALLPHAPVLALEFCLLAAFGRDAAAPQASAWQLLRAWGGEVITGLRVFSWRQPFAADHEPDVAALPGRTGVLLVHGYVCNRGLWAPWLKRFRALGVPCTALSLEPVFGRIDDWVPAIDAAVADLARRTGAAPLLVAHSMGGLAVRAWLAAQQSEHRPGHPGDKHQDEHRVRHVVTVGTPHAGTWLARFARTPSALQMRRGSTWLAALAAQEPAARHARFTCFYGHADNIVFPAGTAMLAGADNRHLAGAAHVQMLFRAEVFDEVLRLLALPAPGR